MKHTPLIIRILGGALLVLLLAITCLPPMMSCGESAAMVALSHRGKPYVFGSQGPDSYDCSGLTLDAYAHFGVELVHSAQFVAYDDQYLTIEDPGDLVPGDLIFFNTVSDRDQCDHVGVWLGMNRFVHASSSEMVVMISEFDEEWQRRYSWSKRIIENKYPASIQELMDAIKKPASEN